MNKNKKSLIIIYPDHLLYYERGLPKHLRYDFPEKAVSDIEVHSSADLERGLGDFFTEKKISSGHLILFLSKKITFQKAIPATTSENTKHDFLESVPFESISSRQYDKKGKHLLVATNKNFITKFQAVFGSLGFEVDAVVPEEAIDRDLKDYASLLKSYDSMRGLSLFAGRSRYDTKIKKMARKQVAASKNLKPLLFLFAFAILVLVGAYFYSQRNTVIPSEPVESRDLTPSEGSPPSNSLTDDPATLNVKIFYLQDSQKNAQILQNNLWAVGFKNTDIFATSSGTPLSSLSLSSKLPATLIQTIRDEMSKIANGYNFEPSDTTISEVTIFLTPGR